MSLPKSVDAALMFAVQEAINGLAAERATPPYGTCNTCTFHREVTHAEVGQCRRHAPSAEPAPGVSLRYTWPRTSGEEGCGEWKPR